MDSPVGSEVPTAEAGLKRLESRSEWNRVLHHFEFVPPGQLVTWSGKEGGLIRFATSLPGSFAAQGHLKRAFGVSRFIIEDGPLIGPSCDDLTFANAIASLRDQLGHNCIISFFSVRPYTVQLEVKLRKAGFQRPWSANKSPITLYVDCCDNRQMLANFSMDWKKNIRRGRNKGLSFEALSLSDPGALADLLDIWRETKRIKGFDGSIDPSTLQTLAECGKCHVFFASRDRVRLSTRLVCISNKIAFDLAGGTTAEGRRASASHFLMNATLAFLAENGVRAFDFGRLGFGSYSNLDQFKCGSGAAMVPYLGAWTLSPRPLVSLVVEVAQFLRSRERW